MNGKLTSTYVMGIWGNPDKPEWERAKDISDAAYRSAIEAVILNLQIKQDGYWDQSIVTTTEASLLLGILQSEFRKWLEDRHYEHRDREEGLLQIAAEPQKEATE